MTTKLPRRRRRRAVPATALLAALLALAPSATAAAVTPIEVAGNPTCPTLMGTGVTEYKREPVRSTETPVPITIDGARGALSVVVRQTVQGPVFDFSLAGGELVVMGVVAKGGDAGGNLYDYRQAGSIADTGLHSAVNPSGKYAGLSHISFCLAKKPIQPPPPPPPPPEEDDPVTPLTPTVLTSTGAPAPVTVVVPSLAAQRGSARLQAPSGCRSSRFTARVTGRQIRRVTFRLDGRRLRAVRVGRTSTGQLYSVRIDPRTVSAGRTHLVAAHVEFTQAAQTRSTILRTAFQRCVRRAVAPRFTG